MNESNPNARLEAFSDGVFAIAITLLVIDIKLPTAAAINDTLSFWLALKEIIPSIFAFLLSFIIIFITWVNHHNQLKLLDKTCNAFLYANGFLLLTVAFIPFPTSLLGEYFFTEYAAPAVVLYNVVLSLQAVGWILITRIPLKYNLGKNEKSISLIRKNNKYGYFAFTLYISFAIISIWFPVIIAVLTAITWIFWLLAGIGMRNKID